jgi:ABC-2 type transport system permease protein
MRVLWSFLQKDLNLLFKKPFTLILLFLVPVAFFAIIYFGFSDVYAKNTFIQPFEVLILDKEESTQSNFLITQLKQTGIFENLTVTTDPKRQESFQESGIPALIIIPENFTSQTSVGANPPLVLLGNPDYPIQVALVENLVRSTTNLVTAGQSALNTYYSFSKDLGVPPNELNHSFQKVVMRTLFLTLSRWDIFKNLSYEGLLNLNIQFYILSAILTLLMGFSALPILKMILDERYYKIHHRLRSARVPLIYSLFSKLLLTLVLSLLQFFMIYFLGRQFFSLLPFGSFHFIRLMALIFLGVFSFSGWIALLMAISTSYPMADMLGNLSLFLMAILGGCLYPLSSLPDGLATIGRHTIHGNLLNGFLMIFANSFQTFHLVLLSLFIWGFVCFGLSHFVTHFRREFS